MVKAMVGGCCVCSDERGWTENPLVYCDGHGCNVAVHQACYGIVSVPKGPWFCRKCESQERIARVKCELCPSKVGALKRTDNGGWAHVVCALYIPEVRFGNVSTMEPIILASVPHDRYLKTCYICEERGKESKTAHGGCMNCNKIGCRQNFHVTCAQSCGLLCEENDGQSGPTVKYVGYCLYHWNKRRQGILFNRTPEKDKAKLKYDAKDVKKPRTSSESSTQSTGTPNLEAVGTPSIDASDVTQIVTVGILNSAKQRGKKPATVKTPPISTNDLLTVAKAPEIFASSGSSHLAVVTSSVATSMTIPVAMLSAVGTSRVGYTVNPKMESTFTPVVTAVNSASHAVSTASVAPVSVHSVAQPTPTPPPVSISISLAKTNNQAKSVSTSKAATAKKRPTSKSGYEPKRKVGRPASKEKSPPKRPSNKQSGKLAGRNTVTKRKSLLNTALPISSPSPLPTSPTYSSYPMGGTAMPVHSSPVPMQNGLLPGSSSSYVTPQPRRHAVLSDSSHDSPEQQNKRQTNNIPLQLPNSLEQLLEYQWEQGAQFLMQQASQYDVASLMSSLHQLQADNSRLEARLESLVARRSQLLQVNARLSAPMSCTPVNTSTTTTDTTSRDQLRPKLTATSSQGGTVISTTSLSVSSSSRDHSFMSGRPVSTVAMVEPTVCTSASSTVPKSSQSDSGQPQVNVVVSIGAEKCKADKASLVKPTVSAQSVRVTPMVTEPIQPMSSAPQSLQVAPTVQKTEVHTTDRQRVVVTAAPIAVLPATQVKIAASHSAQILQKQQQLLLKQQHQKQVQLMSNQHSNSKQPLILPQQPACSQSYNTSQLQHQQFVFLMQQQQQLQQLQQDDLRRQGTARQDRQGPKEQVPSQGQSTAPSAVIPQQYVPTAMGYPSGFVTFSEQLGLATGQSLPKGTTVLSALPVMIDNNMVSKVINYGDKNGTTSNTKNT